MKKGDSVLQSWRVRKAAPYIANGAHVLDVGCSDGALFRILEDRIASGIGIDPDAVPDDYGPFRFIRGFAPDALPEGVNTFDAITLLAVLEHMPPDAQRELAATCLGLLRPGGRVICTVPSPKIDLLIRLGQRFRILDAVSAHEHYGFEPLHAVPLFTDRGFTLQRAQRFQLGLNNLFVFAKPKNAAHAALATRAS
jgi:SAM-dependent methyltransferase